MVRDASMLAGVMVIILGGSATAGALITGRQIASNTIQGRDLRDSSITGRDVKNGSLRRRDFDLASIRGARGAAGNDGADGLTGPQGLSGIAGVRFLSTTVTVTTGNSAVSFLRCNAGEQVIGGGAEANAPSYIGQSAPRTDIADRQGWFAIVYVGNGSSVDFTAVCAPTPPALLHRETLR